VEVVAESEHSEIVELGDQGVNYVFDSLGSIRVLAEKLSSQLK
jgi:hypothetical protein